MVFPVFTILLIFFVTCPAVFSQGTITINVPPNTNIIINKNVPTPNCECSDLTLRDGNSGKQIGNCLTSLTGKFWCYVSATSPCSDKIPAARATGLFYSFQACLGKFEKEPQPAVDGQEFEVYLEETETTSKM
eukprot:GFUD01091526.1.p1 GENE.GFUD01091526.1~~GFUD01091526.1.p1  ORF type:complete len:140 (+),score=29.29 GFUD01091526.1:22-420(+)